MLSSLDHFLAFLIGIVLPFYGFPTWRKLRLQVLQGRAGARKKLYVRTLLIEWVLALSVLIVWLKKARSLSALGVSVSSNPRFVFVLLFVLVACLSLLWQWNQILKLQGNFPDRLKTQIQTFAGIIPETSEEQRLFVLLSITAGICEEFLYRGFLIWYIAFHSNVVLAASISTVLFAFGHGYQGATALWKTLFAGGVLVVFYLISGSLVGPIILHSVNNICTGLIASEVLKSNESPGLHL